MENVYWRRLRRNWRWNLQELYYKAFAIMGIAFFGTIIAFVVDRDDFTSLPLSLLDARPWLFFLFSWTLIRGLQLAWAELFGLKTLNNRFMRYIWHATLDAQLLMLGSFLGVILALIVRGTHQNQSNIVAFIVVVVVAALFPAGLAYGLGDMQRQGFSRRVKRWSGVAAGAFMLIWLGVDAQMRSHQEKQAAATCSPNTNAAVTSRQG